MITRFEIETNVGNVETPNFYTQLPGNSLMTQWYLEGGNFEQIRPDLGTLECELTGKCHMIMSDKD